MARKKRNGVTGGLKFPGENVMKWVFIFLIRFYQKFISPCLPPACRFTPTCSQYFVEALQKKGIVIGSLLGVYRILRCNPFCRGGNDPVPEKTESLGIPKLWTMRKNTETQHGKSTIKKELF